MSNRSLLFKSAQEPNIYEGAFVIYSLRNLRLDGGDIRYCAIRRSSDDAIGVILIGDTNELNLNCVVSGTGLDLGTWIGSDDGFVRNWYNQAGNDPSKVFNDIDLRQPKIINNGAILTKNGKPTIDFDGVDDYLRHLTDFNELDSGNSFTILNVSHTDNSATPNALINNSTLTANDRFIIYNDRRTQKRIIQLRASSSNYFADYLIQQNTSNQKLLTTITNPTNISSYYNSDFQNSTNWSGSYINDAFNVGADSRLANFLNGGIQEIIMFPSDKTSDLSAINADINNYYNIY